MRRIIRYWVIDFKSGQPLKSDMAFALDAYLRERGEQINRALDALLPAADAWPAGLHEAMRYSLMGGGKRVRPILCLASAAACGGDEERALLPAAALECLHAYTLVHDDLPAMDDDDLRRGRPTVHIAYGEANAILAGDALLTLAFELLARTPAPPPYGPCGLIEELAVAAGSRGVAGGQYEDLRAEGGAADAEQLERIHRNKTGKLIQAACRMGAVAAGADAGQLEALSRYGEHVGLAFQIADDILNETATPEELGKAVGSDRARGKMTYVALHGIESSRELAGRLTEQAVAALDSFGDAAEPLRALALFIGERRN